MQALRSKCRGSRLALAFGLTLTACQGERPPSYDSVIQTVTDAERSFAQAVAEKGIRDAFTEYMAEDGILFRPRAVNARSWLAKQPVTPGLLSWKPAFADASAAGDLAFTTGPWEYRSNPAEPPVAHGNYLTVWKRQEDGTWRAVIDHGTYNPPPADTAVRLSTPTPPGQDTPWPRYQELPAELQSLLQTDRAFSGASAARGGMPALTAYVTPGVRVVHNGQHPLTGIAAIRELAEQEAGTLSWQVLSGDIARSGDLGYTYGEYTISDPTADEPLEMGNYLRVWRRQANLTWRVIVDVMSPLVPAG